MTITDKIKTFEDACNTLGINAGLPNFSAIPENLRNSLLAHYKLCIIAEALNEGWTPDWSNREWDKWYPYFYMNSSSSSGRFSFDGSADLSTGSHVGSRLCYKTEELADYAGKQFLDLYKDYFVFD